MALRIAPLSLAALALWAGPAGAQEAFEGVITYQVSVDGRAMTVRHMSKQSKIRQEIEGAGMPGPMVMLIDLETNLGQMVMQSMGMYMEIDLNQAAELAGVSGESASPKVEKLGTSAVVAGIPCEDYRLGEDVEACIASGMGWFVMPRNQGPRRGGGLSGPDFSTFREAFKDGLVPLRVKMLQNGTWEEIMVAEAVERKSLDQSLFVLPSGLRKMSRPGGR